ncbi:lytic transglycosylase domain-containing protein [Maridesulfovibrio bastinii]|uniref:lytic transglycosylase domain-containing protein n=1 Tax=Maridesulfovibrio bastinii TaxID=47157 RepID=UPI00040AA210|nr:lytic transglycosylase domain-containing protein [Maridesulfovibrio bastinii]
MGRYLIPIYLILSGLLFFHAFIPLIVFEKEPEIPVFRESIQNRFRLGKRDLVPIPSLFSQVADEFDLPMELLHAVASHESHYKPWAVNISGRSYYPATRKRALEIIKKSGARSYDIGLMQVNSFWIEKFGLDVADAIIPDENLRLGAWILRYCFKRYGNNWKAVGAYHTGSPANLPEKAEVYARQIYKKYLIMKNKR